MSKRIETIAVFGEGIAGWLAAAALARRVPHVRVAMVCGARPGLADRFGQTTPAAHDFHHDLGLDTRDLIVKCDAALRLGTRFDHYVHAYGAAGPWDVTGDAPFDAVSPGAQLGLAGKAPSDHAVFTGVGYGLQLDPAKYRSYVSNYARHLGVMVAAAGLADVSYNAKGIDALILDDDTRLTADLYVDASNADARLIGALDSSWRDWSIWLPCDSIVQSVQPALAALTALDRHENMNGGWRLTSALPHRTDRALVYDQTVLADSAAATAIGGTDQPIRFRSGRRAQAWVGNVVAIGESHVVLEPLEAAPLHLLHTQIDRLITSLPDCDFAAVELANYNRETNEEADRVRDFLIAHYPNPTDPPPELAETLALFAERARWRQRDGEGYARDDWRAVLFGLGIRPRLANPVAGAADQGQTMHRMKEYRQHLAAAVAAAPTHRDYLSGLRR